MRLLDLPTAYSLWLLLSPLWLSSLGLFYGLLALLLHIVAGIAIRMYTLFTREPPREGKGDESGRLSSKSAEREGGRGRERI